MRSVPDHLTMKMCSYCIVVCLLHICINTPYSFTL